MKGKKTVKGAVDRKLSLVGIAWEPAPKTTNAELIEAMKFPVQIISKAGACVTRLSLTTMPRFCGKATSFQTVGPFGMGVKFVCSRCIVIWASIKSEYYPDLILHGRFSDGHTFDL